MSEADLDDLETLTQDLRMFNEKICVVQINIKASGSKGNEGSDASKTRKIQSKAYLIQQKYGESTKNTSIFGTITLVNVKVSPTFTSLFQFYTSQSKNT